jgi:16S rRNA (adenine1518-N6/adenine1519-N6)-dimethyltransferase
MRKNFGQNFLINPQARRELAAALELKSGDAVWEIGPGLGAMTVELLSLGASVSAFEIDRGFVGVLEELFQDNPRLRIIPGDVRKTWKAETERAPFLLGNLPYNVGALILGELIEAQCFFERMVVTVQKEVAWRISAQPGSKNYSSFSVLCSSAYDIEPLRVLKPGCFYPPPHVDSQALRLSLKKDKEQYPPCVTPLGRALLSCRRKALRNSLTKFLSSRILEGGAQRYGEALLDACGIDGAERPENLGLKEFAALARRIEEGGVI